MFYFHVRATIHIIAKVFIFLTLLASPVYRQAETMTLITMEGYDYWFKILLLGDTGLLFIMDFFIPDKLSYPLCQSNFRMFLF